MNRIKQLRIAKGVKQTVFAKQMGVGQSAISQWEKGRSLPSSDNLIKMCDYFGVSLEYLMGTDQGNPGSIEIPTNKKQPFAMTDEELHDELYQRIMRLDDAGLQRVLDFLAGMSAK